MLVDTNDRPIVTAFGPRGDGCVYIVADEHFDNTFMPRLIADGVAALMPKILKDSLLNSESSEEPTEGIHVVHAGPIKVAVYERYPGPTLVCVHLLTGDETDAAGVTFFGNAGGMTAEFASCEGTFGEVLLVQVAMPDTAGHPLNVMLLKLLEPMRHAFRSGQTSPDALKAALDGLLS